MAIASWNTTAASLAEEARKPRRVKRRWSLKVLQPRYAVFRRLNKTPNEARRHQWYCNCNRVTSSTRYVTLVDKTTPTKDHTVCKMSPGLALLIQASCPVPSCARLSWRSVISIRPVVILNMIVCYWIMMWNIKHTVLFEVNNTLAVAACKLPPVPCLQVLHDLSLSASENEHDWVILNHDVKHQAHSALWGQ